MKTSEYYDAYSSENIRERLRNLAQLTRDKLTHRIFGQYPHDWYPSPHIELYKDPKEAEKYTLKTWKLTRQLYDKVSYLGWKGIGKIAKMVVIGNWYYKTSDEDHRVRKSGEAYTDHPLEVASDLADEKLDSTTIESAMGHDIFENALSEDAGEVILEEFGPEVSKSIDTTTEVSKEKDVADPLETIKKIITRMSEDPRGVIVKFADRRRNMRTMEKLSEKKQNEYAQEAIELYGPASALLGFDDEYYWMAAGVLWPQEVAKARDFQQKINPYSYKDSGHSYSRGAEHVYSTFKTLGISFGQDPAIQVKKYDFRELVNIDSKDQTASFRPTNYVNLEMVCTADDFKNVLDASRSNEIPYKFTSENKDEMEVLIPSWDGKTQLRVKVHTVDSFLRDRSSVMDYYRVSLPEKITKMIPGYNLSDKERLLERMREHADKKTGGLFTIIRQERDLRASDTQELVDNLISEIRLNSVSIERITVLSPAGEEVLLPVGSTAYEYAFKTSKDLGMRATDCYIAHINGSEVFCPLSTLLQTGDRVRIVADEKWHATCETIALLKNDSWKREVRKNLKTLWELAKSKDSGNYIQGEEIGKSGYISRNELLDYFTIVEGQAEHNAEQLLKDQYLEKNGAYPSFDLIDAWSEDTKSRLGISFRQFMYECGVGFAKPGIVNEFLKGMEKYTQNLPEIEGIVDDKIGALSQFTGLLRLFGLSIVTVKIEYNLPDHPHRQPRISFKVNPGNKTPEEFAEIKYTIESFLNENLNSEEKTADTPIKIRLPGEINMLGVISLAESSHLYLQSVVKEVEGDKEFNHFVFSPVDGNERPITLEEFKAVMKKLHEVQI